MVQDLRPAPSIISRRNVYLPNCPDPAGVCLTSDVLALSSESDMKTQPLRAFGNNVSQLWFQIHDAKIQIIFLSAK
jgi:hypothetical protein